MQYNAPRKAISFLISCLTFASGVSDFLICYKGKFISVEAKAGDNGPSALQLNWLASVAKHGGYAAVINELTLWKLAAIFDKVDENE